MDKPSCASCQFFSQPGEPEFAQATGYGLCVRYPESLQQLKTYWCGEYRAAAVAIKEPEVVTHGIPGGGKARVEVYNDIEERPDVAAARFRNSPKKKP